MPHLPTSNPPLPEASPSPLTWQNHHAGPSIATLDRGAEAEDAVAETIATGANAGAATLCARAAPAPDAAPVAFPIVTAFGGLFYLINLGIVLELYGDFTAPAKPGVALSIWDFVAAIGERLVGDRLRADPVWPVLAALAGRHEADAPGRGFDPSDAWRMPPAWLDPFPSSRIWRWSVRQRRLRVQHPAGFCVLDLPADEARTPDDQLHFEMASYTANRTARLRSTRMRGRESPSRVDWWLGHVTSYLRARLALGLHLHDRRAVGRLLLEHDGRVFLTGSELHVVFALADLPIEVRLSGLDRNPGFVPAAGRTVAFHFE